MSMDVHCLQIFPKFLCSCNPYVPTIDLSLLFLLTPFMMYNILLFALSYDPSYGLTKQLNLDLSHTFVSDFVSFLGMMTIHTNPDLAQSYGFKDIRRCHLFIDIWIFHSVYLLIISVFLSMSSFTSLYILPILLYCCIYNPLKQLEQHLFH